MSRIRFRYGQHETFAVRHGWLPKGLAAVARSPDALQSSPEAADRLGLGSKMVPSLAFWVEAAGLATRIAPGVGKASMALTPMGVTVQEVDPYLEHPATWWLMHLGIVGQQCTVWRWFFAHHDDRVFDRNACVDAFARYTRDHAPNPATPATAARDVACLLLAYATDPAGDRDDPDEVAASPLRELGLLWRHAATGRFERRHVASVPHAALLACAHGLAMGKTLVPLSGLAHAPRGAGRLLGLRPADVASAAEGAAEAFRASGARIVTLAGERMLSLPEGGPEVWLRRCLQLQEPAP